MAKINVLPKHIADLIAAGEVVERPSSVIKELMENAIDAGATSLTVEIRNGGVTYMRVTDNGSGILRDDIRNAFVSHATSKILTEEDLHGIGTLGFRGEALASISAVSRVDVLTRTADDEVGTVYKIEGSEEVLLSDAGCPEGTTIVVRDLFYNTPARMKFLKKDVTEGNSVAGVVDRIALSHPEISIRFIRDDKQILVTPGNGNLKSTIYSVFGKDFSNALLETSYELNGVSVDGFVSKPTASRPNRSMQFFFLNGRLVKSMTASAALERAYKDSIMVGKFPACVLNINLPLEMVDVNVHPAKTEVRFSNERPVFDAVYYAAKNAITVARLGVVAQGFEGDTTTRLGFATARNQRNRLASLLHREVVEHNSIDTSRCEHLLDILQRTHLALDWNTLALGFEVLLCSRYRLGNTPCEVDVVILQQNHIEQSDAMVLASAHLHRHLLQHAHSWCGLASVKDLGMEVGNTVGIDCGLCGNATHSLHNIEQNALGTQQRLQVALDIEGHIAHLHAVAIVQYLLELNLRVQSLGNHLCNFYARNDTLLLAQKAHTPTLLGWDTTQRGVVAISNILLDCEFNQLIDIGFVVWIHIFCFFSC